jgi:hypothetical protein
MGDSMKLFGQIVGTLVEVVRVPVAVAKDVVCVIPDLVEQKPLGHRTADQLEEVKDAAQEKP